MTSLLKNNTHNTSFTVPNTLAKVGICTITGSLACSGCPTREEYFIKGSEPKIACDPEEIKKTLEERAKATPTPNPAATGQIL